MLSLQCSSKAEQVHLEPIRTNYRECLGEQLPVLPSSLGSPPAATGCS